MLFAKHSVPVRELRAQLFNRHSRGCKLQKSMRLVGHLIFCLITLNKTGTLMMIREWGPWRLIKASRQIPSDGIPYHIRGFRSESKTGAFQKMLQPIAICSKMVRRYEETDIRSLKKHERLYPNYLFSFSAEKWSFFKQATRKTHKELRENIGIKKYAGMQEMQLRPPMVVESPLKHCSTIIRLPDQNITPESLGKRSGKANPTQIHELDAEPALSVQCTVVLDRPAYIRSHAGSVVICLW